MEASEGVVCGVWRQVRGWCMMCGENMKGYCRAQNKMSDLLLNSNTTLYTSVYMVCTVTPLMH